MTKTTELAHYLDKPISETSQQLAEWLTERTGYPADPRTVALVQSLHSVWQKSPEHRQEMVQAKIARAVTVQEKAARAAAKAAEPKPAKVAASKPVVKPVVKPAAARPRRVAQKTVAVKA